MTRRRLTAFGAVIVLVAAGLLVWKYVVYIDGTRPGSVYETSNLDVDKHRVVFRTPLEPLTITTGDPTDDIDVDLHHHETADGATFIPVSWALGGNDYGFNNEPIYQYQVTLIADGRRYDLQAAQSTENPATKYNPIVLKKDLYVAVQGDGSHLKVEVAYDGAVQAADLDTGKIIPGLAAPYYPSGQTPTVLGTRDCSLLSTADATTFEVQTEQCTVSADLAPHVGGLGWVSTSEQTFALVSVRVFASEVEGRRSAERQRYDLISASVTVTLDGTKPVRDILRYDDSTSINRADVFVFRVAAHPHSLTLTTVLTGRNFTDDSTKQFRNTTTYALS